MRIQRAAQQREVRPHPRDQLGAADDRAAHDIAVAGDELGEAVQEQIDLVLAMLVRAGEAYCRARVSAPCARASRVIAAISATLLIGIGGALEDHQARGLAAQHALDAGQIVDRQQGVSDAELRQRPPDQLARRAVALDEAQHVIALLASATAACWRSRRRRRRRPSSPRDPAAAPASARAGAWSGWRCAGRRSPGARRARLRSVSSTRVELELDGSGGWAPPAAGCRPAPHDRADD